MRKNYTDALLEEYLPKEEKRLRVEESLTDPRTFDALDAARAAVQAKISKLNIELAKLDAECAARMAKDAAEHVTQTSEVTTTIKEENPEAVAAEETTVITADPIEEPISKDEEEFDGLEGLAKDLEEAKKDCLSGTCTHKECSGKASKSDKKMLEFLETDNVKDVYIGYVRREYDEELAVYSVLETASRTDIVNTIKEDLTAFASSGPDDTYTYIFIKVAVTPAELTKLKTLTDDVYYAGVGTDYDFILNIVKSARHGAKPSLGKELYYTDGWSIVEGACEYFADDRELDFDTMMEVMEKDGFEKYISSFVSVLEFNFI